MVVDLGGFRDVSFPLISNLLQPDFARIPHASGGSFSPPDLSEPNEAMGIP